jgi:LexA-binding, inner membrane-associated putative hydrolase
MFIGHFALGFAAKRATPRVSLAVLFAAAQFADLLWPVLVGAGIEHVRIDPGNTAFTPLDFVSYPYSHSLLMLVVWGVVFATIYRRATGVQGAGFILAALVVSHWVLDVITHRPDLPLYPTGPKLGFGLWNSVPGTITLEVVLFAVGAWIYLTGTRARDRVGAWAGPGLVVLLVALYFASMSGVPPTVTALWISAIIGAALLTGLSWWVDRHRVAA